jgi:hypothetical protein
VDRAGPEIIAVHIPKTGGSAFDSVLESVYGADQVERMDRRGQGPDFDSLRRDPDAWRAHMRAEERRTSWPRVITGHFPLRRYERLLRSAFTIVWLREPAAQLLSQYFFYRSDSPLAPGQGAWARAARAVPPERIMEVEWPSNRITGWFLHGYTLDDLDFVGIQEHFAEDVADLGQMLGWPPVDITVHNRTTTREYLEFRPTEELLAKIRAANVELYERALERRRARIAARVV